jgi:hypothetical protein
MPDHQSVNFSSWGCATYVTLASNSEGKITTHVSINDVSVVPTTSSITAIMEAARTSETSVNFNATTRNYIPEDFKSEEIEQIFYPLRF